MKLNYNSIFCWSWHLTLLKLFSLSFWAIKRDGSSSSLIVDKLLLTCIDPNVEAYIFFIIVVAFERVSLCSSGWSGACQTRLASTVEVPCLCFGLVWLFGQSPWPSWSSCFHILGLGLEACITIQKIHPLRVSFLSLAGFSLRGGDKDCPSKITPHKDGSSTWNGWELSLLHSQCLQWKQDTWNAGLQARLPSGEGGAM